MKRHLRVLALSAPHWPIRPEGVAVRSFHADTPFSLQNAVRQAAGFAEAGVEPWGSSNWSTLEGRRQSVLLLEFMDEAQVVLLSRLGDLRPNLVLIGSMTLGLPGAIEIARLTRAELGPECLIVLGGRHTTELMMADPNSPAGVLAERFLRSLRPGGDLNHGGSPLFDLVIGGQGESVISVVGRLVAEAEASGGTACGAVEEFNRLAEAEGDWVAAWLDTSDQPRILRSPGRDLPYESIPTAPLLFGLSSHFEVFDHAPTGHAYSDMGTGCRFDCFFCSERSSINSRGLRGGLAVERLLRHLTDIWATGRAREGDPIGAFIEDSILLNGQLSLIDEFVARLRDKPLRGLRIGCQLTVHDILRLRRRGTLARLREVGVDYVAFGTETIDEEIATRMSKHHRRGGWTQANDSAMEALSEAGIRAGVYVLWGLGETQRHREQQLRHIAEWKQRFAGQPCAVGLNWATLHPGLNHAEHRAIAVGYRPGPMGHTELPFFVDWGTKVDSGALRLLVELFGEASEEYALLPGHSPLPEDLRRLRTHYLQVVGREKHLQ